MFVNRELAFKEPVLQTPTPHVLSWRLWPLMRVTRKQPIATAEHLTTYGMTAPDTRYSYPAEFTPQCSGS